MLQIQSTNSFETLTLKQFTQTRDVSVLLLNLLLTQVKHVHYIIYMLLCSVGNALPKPIFELGRAWFVNKMRENVVFWVVAPV